MSNVNQHERVTQNRIIKLFQTELGYRYLGNWEHRDNNRNIEPALLTDWLTKQGVNDVFINKALRQLDAAAVLGEGKKLYYANKEVYRLLRYGVKDKAGTGEQNQTIWLINWEKPEQNDFAIAEEVSVKGENKKRPDIVLYVNGIALGVIELKRSSKSIGDGIRQNLDNQKKNFIRNFFTTMQLVMAGNDTQGLRYGTIETPEKYYLSWKEKLEHNFKNSLDFHLSCLCNKQRLLEIIHDFMVFDSGIKKTCRHNQYFAVQAAKLYIKRHEGGIIWHTQGSGKSLIMVWLAKWIKEHVEDARVLIVTDRTELDEQIEKVFKGVEEDIYRSTSGADLLKTLHQTNPWLICSLIHKFGRHENTDEENITTAFINELKNNLPKDFAAKGKLFVFVDECHRTQSGKLHEAMQSILPQAMFVGFTGTPLLKKDKKKSIEIFGNYVHTYKFNEAVADGVILDLLYEARDIDQSISSQQKVDEWFEAKTRGLTNLAKLQLKQKWGTLRKVLSSKSRLQKIVNDILMDMDTKPHLMNRHGNALLVCASIYQACKVYEMFSNTDLAGKCAIITSYKPSPKDIKGEETGEGLTEKLHQYAIYRKMLSDYFEQSEDKVVNRIEEFEKEIKQRFIKEPGQVRLLIVVDKLLTGFDAPSATYLYIDKKMQDHGLFQAICRVNRLDGDNKKYGYIVDYKDLFKRLQGTISDYTGGALAGYDAMDVFGLLGDRLEKIKQQLEQTRETIKALCEPVMEPRDTKDYLRYFNASSEKEFLRIGMYKAVAALIRAYCDIANEMLAAGYSKEETMLIKKEVIHFDEMRNQVKLASGDGLDLKRFEPSMRHLLDMYIQANDSNKLIDFEEMGLIKLIVENGDDILNKLPDGIKNDPETMSEVIENNIRKIIVDENPVNPKYYEKMSELLDDLIAVRRKQAISYQEHLKQIKLLAKKVVQPNDNSKNHYPETINTAAKRALYDNLNNNELLTLKIDKGVRYTKKADWLGDRFKEREVANMIREETATYEVNPSEIFELVKNQHEYQ